LSPYRAGASGIWELASSQGLPAGTDLTGRPVTLRERCTLCSCACAGAVLCCRHRSSTEEAAVLVVPLVQCVIQTLSLSSLPLLPLQALNRQPPYGSCRNTWLAASGTCSAPVASLYPWPTTWVPEAVSCGRWRLKASDTTDCKGRALYLGVKAGDSWNSPAGVALYPVTAFASLVEWTVTVTALPSPSPPPSPRCAAGKPTMHEYGVCHQPCWQHLHCGNDPWSQHGQSLKSFQSQVP